MATYHDALLDLAENPDVTVLWDSFDKFLPPGWQDLEIPEDTLKGASERLDADWQRTLKILEFKRELRKWKKTPH
jgi:hypothetical protein